MASSHKPIEWREEDKAALEWWETLETENDRCSCDAFAQALSEEWDCTGAIAHSITRALVTVVVVDREDMVAKEAFYLFVRAFGPFGTGKNNSMYLLLVRDFFEADGKTPRGNFHGHIDEKRSYALIKEPGEFFYRYSSRNMDSLCVVRVSRSKFPNGEWAKAAEILVNNRQGGWIHTVKDKPNTLYSSLGDYEKKNAEKVFKLVKTGTAATPSNNYAASMTTFSSASSTSYPPLGSYPSFPSSSNLSSSYPSPDSYVPTGSYPGLAYVASASDPQTPLLDRMVSGADGLVPISGPNGSTSLYSSMMAGSQSSHHASPHHASPHSHHASPHHHSRSHLSSIHKQFSGMNIDRRTNEERPPDRQTTGMYSSQMSRE